jgi:APA family basic amino acid/polyamine antiporter
MKGQPMEHGGLQQRVGLLGVVTLGAGVAIGVSIFTVLQPAAQLAGSGLLVAMVLAALPMVIFALVYAHLASVAPVSGASYEWPRRFLHPAAGFLITWCRILSNVGALTIYSKVLAQYLGMVIALPVAPVMTVTITAVFALNYFGVGIAARVQNGLMLGLLFVLGAFVLIGLPHVAPDRIGSPFATDATGIAACVVLMISLFLGIESAVEIGEEVRDSKRTIPRGIALAILVTMLAYAAVAATALGLVGPAALAASPAPLLTAAKVPFGALATPIIVIAATASLLKSMNAGALVFSRSLFAMARGGTLWSGLAVIDPRSGVLSV